MRRHTEEGTADGARGNSARITVPEIARRLQIGRLSVYAVLEQRIIPGIRPGRQWIITRYAYEAWERTWGCQASAGLSAEPEVTVLT
jgi:excisionase family DNA binding protein